MSKRNSTIVPVILAIVARVLFFIRELNGTITEKSFSISHKNNKLVPNKETAFFIWNLPAVFTCPFATDECIKNCYALKAERRYPFSKSSAIRSRVRNYLFSKRDDFVEIMTNEILRYAKNCHKNQVIVRIHESGDFYNRKYADKWLQIMVNCSVDSRIQFIAYTKSFKFFDGKKLPDNFALRASVWDDTAKEQKEIIKKNNWPVYTAVPKFTVSDTFHQCRCKDCATCAECWKKTPLICCEIH